MTRSNAMIRSTTFGALRCGALVLVVARGAAFAKQEAASFRYYYVDAAVVSLDASKSLASYQSHGRGSGSPGSTLGYSTPDTDIKIALSIESNRFYADVILQSRGKEASES